MIVYPIDGTWMTCEEYMKKYNVKFTRAIHEINQKVNATALQEDIPPALEAPIVWSYTFLHTFAGVCEYQAYRRYIAKNIPFKETPALAHGIRVHEAMEQRLKGSPLPEDLRQFEPFAIPFDNKGIVPEMKLGIDASGKPVDFFAKNVWGRGKIDVPIISGSVAYIGDWKTSSKDTYEHPFELQIHAVLLKAKFPTLETIKGQYIYLGLNKTSQVYDLSNTLEMWGEINRIMTAVDLAKQAKGPIPGYGFKKRKNPLCSWCPVTDCQYNTSNR